MSFKIENISTDLTYLRFVRALKKNENIEKISAGAYARVFSSKDRTDCFKVGMFEYKQPWTDGYMTFVNQMQEARNNAFFPKIHSVQVFNSRERNESWYCVRMEKLQPLPKDFKSSKLCPVAKMALRSLHLASQKSLEELISVVETLGGENKTSNDLVELCSALIAGGERFTLDVHHFNVMRRDEQIVVIDPYGEPKKSVRRR